MWYNLSMKILFITKSLKPNSGWGRHSSELVKRFEKYGEVILFVENKDGTDDLKNTRTIIYKNKFNPIDIILNISKLIYFGYKSDFIIAFDLHPFGLYAYIASIFSKGKLVINGIGTYSIAPLNKKYFKKIFRLIYKKASSIICISAYTKNEIDKLVIGAKTEIVHMGLSSFAQVEANNEILAKYNVSEENFPVIVTVGEIKNRKGQLETAKAVASLKGKYPKIKYLVVGSDRDVNYVNKIKEVSAEMGEDNIVIVNDAKSDSELKAIYSRADIFALNSNNDSHGHFEGFGLVVLEANQFGVPAIGSRGCGIEDAMSDGVNGYLCDQQNVKDNYKDIAEKMEKVLEMKKDNKDYWVDKCKVWAHSFDWDKTVAKYLEIYNK
jgi:phosphatidyl-myo-inositol dimannoside synthase